MFDRFGEKLRSLRKHHGMTLVELAQTLGFTYHSNSYLSLIEQGKKKPTAEIIFKVAKLFHVSADVLMDDTLDLPDLPDTLDAHDAS